MQKYIVSWLKGYDFTHIRGFFNDNNAFIIDTDYIFNLYQDTEDFFNTSDTYEFNTFKEAQEFFDKSKLDCQIRILNINRKIREHDSEIDFMRFGNIVGLDYDLRVDVLNFEIIKLDEDGEVETYKELEFYTKSLTVSLNGDLTIKQEVS